MSQSRKEPLDHCVAITVDTSPRIPPRTKENDRPHGMGFFSVIAKRKLVDEWEAESVKVSLDQ